MINKKLLFTSGKAGLLPGSVLLVMLTGCVGYVDGPSAGVYVAPPVVEVSAPADYIYYPGYDVYFNSSRNQYAYLDGGVWVSRPAPIGVSIDVLMASPSVRMDFHDSPANHNADMVRAYPRSWAPPGGRQVERPQAERGSMDIVPAGRTPARSEQVRRAPEKKEAPKAEKRDDQGEK
jgi:hypothetical protein